MIVQKTKKERKPPYKPVTLRKVYEGARGKDMAARVQKFATIDIETQDWVNYVCGEIYWFDKDGIERSFETDDPLQLMIKCFEIKAKDDVENFVAHYGGKFDFLFFMENLFPKDYFEIKSIIPRGSSILSFETRLLETSEHKFDFEVTADCKVTFRDSSALLPYSLGSLTKSFKVETLKGEMDFLFIEDVYKEKDYIPKILTDNRCVLFWSNKQAFKLNADMLRERNRPRLRYWNMERFPLVRYKAIKPKNKLMPLKKLKWKWEDVTFPIFTKKDLLLYLHHDCKSLYQCIEAFFKAPLIDIADKKWTTAGQSVQVYRLFAPCDLHSLPDSDEWAEGNVDAYVRKAYFGGRTEVFKPIFDSEVLEKDFLYYYDVNSLYPFCMRNFRFPDKFLRWSRGSQRKLRKDYEEHTMSIWTARVRVPDMYIPPLPVKAGEDGRLIFPTGTFVGHWTKHEIEYAKTLGCEVLELIEGSLFADAGYIFKTFVDTLYDMRKEAKKKGDNVAQMTMKLLMNSCYGKMGINKDQEKIIIDDGSSHDAVFLADLDMPDGSIIRLATQPERSPRMFSNPAIACHVTSYARVHLHKQFMIVGPKSVYYCDTDSVFTSEMMPVGDEVGMMKLEYKCKSACFLLPKTYVNEGIIEEDGKEKAVKLTMKGFDYKNIQGRFGFQDFMDFLGGERDKIFANEKPRFATFKTALRQGKFVTMKNDPKLNRQNDERREKDYFEKTGKKKRYVKDEYKLAVKQLKGYYTKREIIENGFDTKPLILNQ